MGETSETYRPVWRTRLAAVMVAWMAVVIGLTLAAPRLVETAPPSFAPIAIVAIYLVPPPLLLVWSFWTMLREPMTGWIAPTLLMTFLGGFVPAFQPLLRTGVRMNFEAHRPAYEAIAADAKAGRLVGAANGRGWVEGEHGGVRFRYRATDPSFMEFPWVDRYGLGVGIRYDETPCVPRPELKCIARGEPLTERFSHYTEFF
jgi:hypothetical protein